jgi:hypothetical protein
MNKENIACLTGLIVGILLTLLVVGGLNEGGVEEGRKQILTGEVICKPVGLDEDGEIIFKCIDKAEIEEVFNFLGVGVQNDRRQERKQKSSINYGWETNYQRYWDDRSQLSGD